MVSEFSKHFKRLEDLGSNVLPQFCRPCIHCWRSLGFQRWWRGETDLRPLKSRRCSLEPSNKKAPKKHFWTLNSWIKSIPKADNSWSLAVFAPETLLKLSTSVGYRRPPTWEQQIWPWSSQRVWSNVIGGHGKMDAGRSFYGRQCLEGKLKANLGLEIKFCIENRIVYLCWSSTPKKIRCLTLHLPRTSGTTGPSKSSEVAFVATPWTTDSYRRVTISEYCGAISTSSDSGTLVKCHQTGRYSSWTICSDAVVSGAVHQDLCGKSVLLPNDHDGHARAFHAASIHLWEELALAWPSRQRATGDIDAGSVVFFWACFGALKDADFDRTHHFLDCWSTFLMPKM